MGFLKGDHSMVDCSKEILKFHNNKVRLPQKEQEKLRGNRKANQDRLKKRLAEQEKPSPVGFVKQGSYAMHTMVQQDDNDYDIDDGVIFLKEDLKGKKGADMASLAARQMVCDALQDDRFNRDPEVRTNCVRVYYDAGHHVDIPVYREDPAGSQNYELASSDWKESDPAGVTVWFNQAVIDQSPDKNNGRQMRRMVCLLKKFARSRSSWNMPSGLVLSKLADEKYSADENREDVALYETMRLIHQRLEWDLEVRHPVVANEWLTDGEDDPKTRQLRDKIEEALDNLQVLFDEDCTRKEALKAWKKVFNDDYFDDLIKDSDGAKDFGIVGATPTRPVDKKGGGRFG